MEAPSGHEGSLGVSPEETNKSRKSMGGDWGVEGRGEVGSQA